MKHKIFLITGLVAIIFLLSCNGRNQTDIVAVNLVSQKIAFDESVFLKYPYRIKKIDSLLFVWDLHAQDNFFHVFSLNNNATKHFYSFGKVGNGPEELISCGGFEVTDSSLSVIESSKAILYSYSFEHLKKGTGKPDRMIEFPKEYVPIVKFTDRGNKGKVILDSKGECRFILLNNEGKTIDKCYSIPNKENKDLSNFILPQLWTSCLSYNQHNDILVLGTTMGDVLEIYHLKDKTQKIVVGKQGEPSVFREGTRISLLSANGYQDVIVGDSAIYALYSQITPKEVRDAQEKNEIIPNGGNFIYVFSLDGEMKKVFELDEYINGFSIDFKKNIVYGVTSNSDIQLCIFNLPNE